MDDSTPTDENYGDDELPMPEQYAPSVPTTPYNEPEKVQLRLDFRPWHRPRKHYVRVKQWQSLLETVLSKQPEAEHEVAYLGLPGQDLIDVELFSGTCADKGRSFHFVGFDNSLQRINAGHHNEADGDGSPAVDTLDRVTADRILRLPGVSRTSRVLPDDISELGSPKSTARLAVGNRSFDIVNLDLCGAGLVDKNGDDVLVPTLAAILQLQAGRDWPWGLLVTAAFDREGHSAQQKARSATHIHDLHTRLEDCKTSHGTLPTSLSSAEALTDAEYSLGAVGGFVSWVREAAQDVRRSNVPCKSAMSYRLQANSSLSEMWSLAMLVTPKRQVGNALNQASANTPEDGWTSNCAALQQLVGRLGATVDVDAVLRDDPDVYAAFRTSTATLLEARGYDQAAYLESDIARAV